MKKLALLFCLAAFSLTATAQDKAKPAPSATPEATLPTTKLSDKATPVEMARAAFNAHGGENLRKLKSLALIGSVDIYPATVSNAVSGKFAHIVAGDKLRREINAPPAPFVRIIDNGQQVYVSVPGVQLPPTSYFGMYLLPMFDKEGYTVGPLRGDEKKKRGFSVTTPEETWTDFYVDLNTGRLIGYSFVYQGYLFGSELKKHTVVNGVLVPFNFTEALNLPIGTFYIEFKVKEAKTDIELADDVFAIPQK